MVERHLAKVHVARSNRVTRWFPRKPKQKGKVAEWSIASVLKTDVTSRLPRVRIPPFPGLFRPPRGHSHGPSTPKRPISILSIFDYYERRLLTYTSKSRASTTEQGIVVQLVRAPPCHGGSCGFESRQSRFHISLKSDSSRTDRTEAHPIEVGVVLVAHA